MYVSLTSGSFVFIIWLVLDQSSSMIINHHQSSSMIFNHHQWSSIIINHHQWSCHHHNEVWITVEIVNFSQNCEFQSKLWISVKIVNFSQNCEFQSKLWIVTGVYALFWNAWSGHLDSNSWIKKDCSLIITPQIEWINC